MGSPFSGCKPICFRQEGERGAVFRVPKKQQHTQALYMGGQLRETPLSANVFRAECHGRELNG